LLGCVLSGAGPSVLVFYEEGAEACCELVTKQFAEHGQQAEIIKTRVAPEGFRVLSKV